MKNLFFLITIIIVSSCSNSDKSSLIENENISKHILESKALIADNIELPVGTKWFYSDDTHSGVEFELPKGYKFLLFDTKSGEAFISNNGAGYSCTCSGEGSCTTFYNEQVGYGCLHNTCTGTCSGKNTLSYAASSIEGVLYMENDKIDVKSKIRASLSDKGKDLIFGVSEFENEFKEVNDFLYKYIDKPNFEKSNLKSILDSKDYLLARVFLYGFEFSMIIPNDDNLKSLLPNLEVSDEPTSCSCSGESKSSSCDLKKKGALGYVAYYCNGCTTCTMN